MQLVATPFAQRIRHARIERNSDLVVGVIRVGDIAIPAVSYAAGHKENEDNQHRQKFLHVITYH